MFSTIQLNPLPVFCLLSTRGFLNHTRTTVFTGSYVFFSHSSHTWLYDQVGYIYIYIYISPSIYSLNKYIININLYIKTIMTSRTHLPPSHNTNSTQSNNKHKKQYNGSSRKRVFLPLRNEESKTKTN